ncbi:MAG: glycoside hydrolase family 88/105 protein [Ignavibacteriaceae bacterium]
MKYFFSVTVVILFAVSNLFALNGINTGNGENNKKLKSKKDWAILMTDSFMASHPKYISYDSTKPKWDYEFGFMLYAIWNLYEKTGDQKYFNYIKDNLDYYISNDGQIKTYKFQSFRLDDIEPGRALVKVYEKTGDEKYKLAAFLLRKQLSEQPRTKDGGFWHKKIYEHQMWLDGLYMAEPFYAEFAAKFNEPKDFDDIAHQFILMYEHAKDKNTGLLYHGWDESKTQKWANPKTGDSPSFWGRAMGWYLMGLVDVLDYFPKDNPQRGKLISILQEESKVLLRYKDKKTNLWYLILDKPGKNGNYLEASSSAMFMYAFAKGAKKGYLSKKYYAIAKEIFSGFTLNLIKENNDGIPSIINTISGAGLGGKPYSDGSFQYYAGVLKRTNDFKAIAPFILASLELGK